MKQKHAEWLLAFLIIAQSTSFLFNVLSLESLTPFNLLGVRFLLAFAVLAVIAFFANRMIGPGANYLFLARPEDTPSILDFLPPNYALRLLVMASVVTALFVVAYLPWYVKDKKAKKETVTA